MEWEIGQFKEDSKLPLQYEIGNYLLLNISYWIHLLLRVYYWTDFFYDNVKELFPNDATQLLGKPLIMFHYFYDNIYHDKTDEIYLT